MHALDGLGHGAFRVIRTGMWHDDDRLRVGLRVR